MPPKKKKPPQKKKPPVTEYTVHEVHFAGKPASVVCRSKASELERCSLLGLCNLLLLRNAGSGTPVLQTVERSDGTRCVSVKELHNFVLGYLAHKLAELSKAGFLSADARTQRLVDFDDELAELHGGFYLLPEFSRTDAFMYPIGLTLLTPLCITLRHALCPDPEDACLSAIKGQPFLDLLKELSEYDKGCEAGLHYEESKHHKNCLVKGLLQGPLFSTYGYGLLREEAPEDELFLLLLDQEFHVVYKKEGQLYLLSTNEDTRNKYPDVMWIGLDENFNAVNPAGTKRKLTSSFSPVNQFLEELEEEKRRSERRFGKTSSQKEAPATCLPAKEATHGNQVKTVEATCDNAKGGELKLPETAFTEVKKSVIVVPSRFLRFVHRRLLTFKEFISSCTMHKIYRYKLKEFISTSHIGRLIPKGYLEFVFKVHRSGYSWNGDFREEDMFVELELVDGVSVGGINFFITLPPLKDFKKSHGMADLSKLVTFLFHHYLPKDFKELPFYFRRFEDDIAEMPEFDDPPEKMEKFQKYMSDHLFAKAPLVRATLVCGVYDLCDSEIFHVDQTQPKPRCALLDVEIAMAKRSITTWLDQLSEPLKQIYTGSRVATHFIESNRWTCWDAIELGRHSKNHMMDNTKENGVQNIDDPIILDLIVEHDLNGMLTDAIKFMIQKTNFKGRFESTWEHFSGSEPRDGGERMPFFSGDTKVHVAIEQEAAALPVAEIVPETEAAAKQVLAQEAAAKPVAETVPGTEAAAKQVLARFISDDFGVRLTLDGLRSLEGEQWILDEVIHFAYSEMSSKFQSIEDLCFVPPNLAHTLTNLPEDSNPLHILDPGNHNLLLFPVNNSESHDRGDSGYHWSLLVLRVDKAHNTCSFVHHDSILNMNQGAAKKLFGNLKLFFPNFDSVYLEAETPQQANGYDCGVYVIILAHKIASWWKKVKSGQKAETDGYDAVCMVNPEMVSNARHQLLERLKKKFSK